MLMNDFAFDQHKSPFDLPNALNSGNVVLLCDDVDMSEAHISVLNEFVRTYPRVRVIATVTADVPGSKLRNQESLEFEIAVRFIYSFNRRQTKSLVSKWFGANRDDLDDVAESVMEDLTRLSIPRSPVMISLLLWIFEAQRLSERGPTNRATLVEQFVQIVLEKLNTAVTSTDKMDYRNREHYLSYVAEQMVHKNEFALEPQELERMTLQYFDERGLSTAISPFIEYFYKKEILIRRGDVVEFKIRCIGEYFIAKAMMESQQLYAFVVSDERYLSFFSEIDFLTGFQRNNKALLELLGVWAEAKCRKADVPMNIDEFAGLKPGVSMLVGEDGESLAKRVASQSEQREILLDQIYDQTPLIGDKQSIEKTASRDATTEA